MRRRNRGMPVGQRPPAAEDLEAQQRRAVFSAEVIVLGSKFRNVRRAWSAEKREQVPQVVQVDAVDEDVRITLLQAGHSFGGLCGKTKVGAGGSSTAVQD